MATNAGHVVAYLDANTASFVKGFSKASEQIGKFAAASKKLSNDMREVSMTVALAGGAALKLASSVNAGAKTALDNLSKSVTRLAVPIAQMLIPAVKQLTGWINTAAQYMNGLDPGTKAAIANFVALAVGLGAVALVAGKVFTVLESGAMIMKGLASVIGAVGVGSLISILLTIGLIVGALVLLHRAWRKNWGGIQEATADVVKWFGDAFKGVFAFIGKLIDGVIDNFAGLVEMILSAVDVLQKLSGVNLVDTAGLREGFKGLFGDLKSGEFFTSAFKFGKDMGEQLVDGFVEELGEIKKKLSGLLPTLTKGALPSAGPAGPVRSGALSSPMLSASRSAVSASDSVASGVAEGMARYARHLGQGTRISSTSTARTSALDASIQQEAFFAKQAAEWAGAIDNGVNLLVSKLGDAGSIVNSAVQGAQAGGVWGAVIAVIVELVSRMQSFLEVVDILNNGTEKLIGSLNSGLSGIFEGIGQIFALVFDAVIPLIDELAPALQAIGDVVKMIAPLFLILGILFKGLAPVIEVIVSIVSSILQALEPIIAFLYNVGRVVTFVILGFVRLVLDVWNGIVDVLAGAVDAIVSIFSLGAITDGGNFLRAWKADTAGVTSAMNTLEATSYDAAKAQSAASTENYKAAAAAADLAEELLNVPSGFKLDALRFGATMPGLASLSGGIDGAAASGGGGMTVGTMVVTVEGATWEDVKDEITKEGRHKKGTPTRDEWD